MMARKHLITVYCMVIVNLLYAKEYIPPKEGKCDCFGEEMDYILYNYFNGTRWNNKLFCQHLGLMLVNVPNRIIASMLQMYLAQNGRPGYLYWLNSVSQQVFNKKLANHECLAVEMGLSFRAINCTAIANFLCKF
ncbi:uncharacterized protein LOC106671971 [Cimex lectularius]|uniref:C-type lectin n=1 Tax=Cimex lectularius TaxID=79782 RepID=A0A8I6S619_CIMLE|nr:uncharacterized protein LOC106671971 [Cimex lectularius]